MGLTRKRAMSHDLCRGLSIPHYTSFTTLRICKQGNKLLRVKYTNSNHSNNKVNFGNEVIELKVLFIC